MVSNLVLCLAALVVVILPSRGDTACDKNAPPSAPPNVGVQEMLTLLAKTSIADSWSFKCNDVVPLVNSLRQLGKEKSLAVLRDYLAQNKEIKDNAKVILICRLLFVNPKGWPQPRLGTPVPAVDEKVSKDFPLFPFVVVDRVPFQLVRGYDLLGMPESAADCLKLCDDLSLIKEDYSLNDPEKAAKSLTESESFRKLYKQELHREVMMELILAQAKKKN